MKPSRILKTVKKGVRVVKNDGLISFGIKALKKIENRNQAVSSEPMKKKQFISLVDRSNVMLADWSNFKYKPDYSKVRESKHVAWIMSPPSGGGGHQNIFRFIDFLDEKGYKNDVYLYSTFDDTTTQQAKENTKAYSSAKNVNFQYYKDKTQINADIIFATGWETAYPVFNQKTDALKFYFVQDFEPLFYPMGTDYILAENTYKFGLRGITAGGWLAKKLNDDYGMKTDSYDFGANKELYSVTNNGDRKDVFFYARPVTERRGFDLGLMVLELFHEQMPECTIHFAGWDVSEWNVPFPYINHKAMPIDELNNIYNSCSAALVISLTNMSLLPLELLASGVVPIVNDGPNNKLVSNNSSIKYIESSPRALADALVEAVKLNSASQQSKKISDSVTDNGWEEAGKKFMKIIDKELNNG